MLNKPAGYMYNSDYKRINPDLKTAPPEVYTHDVMYYSDEYIEINELDIKKDNLSMYFSDMMFYIHDRIQPIDNDDIETLNHLFNLFIRLCSKFNTLPTLYNFSILSGVDTYVFDKWCSDIDSTGSFRNKLNSTHKQYVKNWINICKHSVINKLHNQNGTNANLIFIAKAGYGMRETAPIPAAQDTRQTLTAADLPVLDCSVDDQDTESVKELTDDS